MPGYSTHVITDRSIEFTKRNKDNPFFLYVSHAAVHNPYQTVEDTPDNRVEGENPNRINDKNRDKYRWMLQDLDKGVGQILDTLNELDLAKNTLVVFFSDNGAVGMSPKQFRRFRGGKFSHYEGGYRVPAVAWWPGKINAGVRSNALIVGFDLFPTLTHYRAVSLKGNWVVKVKTAADRFTRAVRSIDKWCHDHRHLPPVEQQQKLNQKLHGHYAYYGLTGNSGSLSRFQQEVESRWRKWLNRRKNIRSMHWQKFCALLRRYPLAPARATRSKLPSAAKP